jgi:hypothetical protein
VLLANHASHQRAAAPAPPALTDAERRAQQAENDRQLALEAATHARTEAERLIAEERAKLLAISKAQADFDTSLEEQRTNLKAHSEKSLTFERRVGDMRDQGAPSAASADELYVELRAWLRSSRDELANALSAPSVGAKAVPTPGDDALADLPSDVDRSAYDRTRQSTIDGATRLSREATAFNDQRIEQLGEEIRGLNQERLALLPLLSPAKRTAITGFGFAGLDQAAAELRQVTLVLRFHLHEARDWIATMGMPDAGRRKSVAIGATTAEWLFATFVFVWWRRRAASTLVAWRGRVEQRDRRERAVEPSPLYKALGFLLRVRPTLEWMVFGWALLACLPAGTTSLLEVDLVRTIFFWTFGAALAIATIDALAGPSTASAESADASTIAALRLRSLRLVGRTVVVFGLILSMTAQLVGRGTIHSWVSSTCWFASVPIALLVVRWWREEIFRRIRRTRKKSAFDNWIERNQTGWGSFFAAAAGGAYLFASGTVHATRNWVGRFDVTRRALAYLFRRGLDRLAEENATAELGPLPESTFLALGPEVSSTTLVRARIDDESNLLAGRIDRNRGGVFALVGERGSGKTTLLNEVRARSTEVVFLDCPFGGLGALEAAVGKSARLDSQATLDDSAKKLNMVGGAHALLIDDAHRLIRPVMGGLSAFDRLVAAARGNSSRCAWVFAMDEVVWRFFQRARGARPLFDDVLVLSSWREEDIAELIRARSTQAAVHPNFRNVVQRLAADADEVDVAEATSRTEANYHRLLWDYSSGNPAVALHLWRKSLGVDQDGATCVKAFQAPDTADLEQLPDPAVFVLRAVVQLERATTEDIVAATMLQHGPVEDTLRYGVIRGYFEHADGRYRVTWAWFRAVTRFLQWRHLLARG